MSHLEPRCGNEDGDGCSIWEHDHRPWYMRVYWWDGWSAVAFFLWSFGMVLLGRWIG